MAQEISTILQGDERLWDVALRGIGISLPDEYILRFTRLLEEVSKTGLKNITLDDMVTIQYAAHEDVRTRTEQTTN
ncbi:MAG: hypothetical protein IJV24_07300 [Prevotella sp.]|nr:hypothetical protein [Prevotella sp.]